MSAISDLLRKFPFLYKSTSTVESISEDKKKTNFVILFVDNRLARFAAKKINVLHTTNAI